MVLFFLRIRHRKNNRQHTDGTSDGYEGVMGNPGTTTPNAPRPTQSKPKTM